MRLAFAGTPEFARAALARVHAAGFEVALVLTQPDRAAGRGMKLLTSPVKAFALEHGIAVAQPRGLRLDGRFAADAAAAEAVLRDAAVDVIVVAAYGLILPPWLLALPAHGCLNIHASLLPRWRGAAPIQRAIEAGDATSGVTIMQMDVGLDTGAMLLAAPTDIDAGDTTSTLLPRLAELGARLIVQVLTSLDRGVALSSQPQPAAGVTYATKIEKAEAIIDWREAAVSIERRLRAFDPFPGARSSLDGEVLTLWRGYVREASGGQTGEVLAVGDDAITVACGTGSLAVTELQRPGGRRLPAAEFLRGRASRVGSLFGS